MRCAPALRFNPAINTQTGKTVKNRNALLLLSAFTLLPALADAGVIIDSINVKMTGMRYGVRNSADPAATFASARTDFDRAFATAGSPCNVDLAALTDVSYRGACGSNSQRDYGSLYTITGSVMGPAVFEFGLDWGRGGFIAETSGSDGSLVYLDEDVWWRKNWDDEDVQGKGTEAAASILIPQASSFTLTLLGFEACCDGVNSGRYRSLGYSTDSGPGPLTLDYGDSPGLAIPMGTLSSNQPNTLTSTFTFGNGLIPVTSDGAWNELAVNAVPLPANLPLLCIGAAFLARGRRARGRPANV